MRVHVSCSCGTFFSSHRRARVRGVRRRLLDKGVRMRVIFCRQSTVHKSRHATAVCGLWVFWVCAHAQVKATTFFGSFLFQHSVALAGESVGRSDGCVRVCMRVYWVVVCFKGALHLLFFVWFYGQSNDCFGRVREALWQDALTSRLSDSRMWFRDVLSREFDYDVWCEQRFCTCCVVCGLLVELPVCFDGVLVWFRALL